MFDLALWAMGASIVVGIIQWLKPVVPKAPLWVFIAALPLCSFAASFAYGGDRPIWNALGIWAIAQLGYEIIVQTVKSKLAKG